MINGNNNNEKKSYVNNIFNLFMVLLIKYMYFQDINCFYKVFYLIFVSVILEPSVVINVAIKFTYSLIHKTVSCVFSKYW